MKFKWMMACLALLFLTIGVASACDNMTDCVLSQSNLTELADDDAAGNINVSFEEQMWKENLSDISVDLPESASGEFAVKIDDEVIYNQTITDKSFKVPIKLPKPKFEWIINIYPPLDCKNYRVSAFLNGVDLNINKTLKVMTYSPDYDCLRGFPKEIIRGDDGNSLRYAIIFPRSANGIAEVYVDEKLVNKTKVTGPFLQWNSSKITNLALGNHTLRLLYYNDTYYHSLNKTVNFTVVNVLIDIPEVVNISHDSCVAVDVLKNVGGTVKIYLDGKLICNKKYEDYFVFDLEKYLKFNSSEVMVEFTSKQFSRTKIQKIQIAYDFDVYQDNLIYGEDNRIEIYLPDYMNNNLLTVSINGTQYKFTHPSQIMNNVVDVDVSRLQAGNYSMFISYPGDDRFEAKNKTFNFTVSYAIMTPSFFISYKDGSKVYLNLPGDANGNLIVYVDGELYKSAMLDNGKAAIMVDAFAPGEYELKAVYDGGDFEIESESFDLHVSPYIKIDTYFRVGEEKSIVLKVPKSCKGMMTVTIDGKEYKVKVKNGKAAFSLKKLKIGEYEVEITFEGENGYSDYDYFDVEVIPAKTKIKAGNVNVMYKKSFKYKIKLLGKTAKPLKNKVVKFKIGKKTYKVKTNKKGIASIKLTGLKAKTYKIKVSYRKVKITRKIHVNLIDVDAKKSKSKLMIMSTLYKAVKGKTVTFKLNGKTYKAKTNSKGIAKVNIKLNSLPKGKIKYQASYHKNTVKRTIRI